MQISDDVSNKETRDLFTALSAGYDITSGDSININLKEVRTRFGGVVKESLSFEEAKVENMPTSLNNGEYAAFVADLEFKNVKFLDMFGVRL